MMTANWKNDDDLEDIQFHQKIRRNRMLCRDDEKLKDEKLEDIR